MIPNIVDGGDTAGLMRYLVGPGRANEHTDQHLVAGSGEIMRKWGDWSQLTTAQATEIARMIDQYMRETKTEPVGPVREFNPATGQVETTGNTPNHVWHCSLSLSPEEPALSDQQWAEIAQEFMDAMGFTGTDGKAPCRWVAVHHGVTKNGGDHIHIAANIVREDGTKWSRWYDQRRSQRICGELEERFGLHVIESRQIARGARADSAAAQQMAARTGAAKTDRQELEDRLRAAVAASSTEVEFIERARELGVRVRPRFAPGSADEVTGYSAALHTTGGQRTNWWGGGKIARDLALPVLRRRWPSSKRAKEEAAGAWRDAWAGLPVQRGRMAAGDEAWVRAADAVERVLERMGQINPTDRTGLADAAHDAAGILASAATAYERARPDVAHALWKASRSIGRAAQLHHHEAAREPRLELIGPARLLLTAASAGQPGQNVRLLADLMRLSAAVIALHQRAGQLRTAEAMLRDAHDAWAHLHSPTPLRTYVAGLARFQTWQQTNPDAPTQQTQLPQKKQTSDTPLTIEQLERARSIYAATAARSGTITQAGTPRTAPPLPPPRQAPTHRPSQ